MKVRVFTTISLLALLVAMMAAGTASAQSPADDVYDDKGEVADVVSGGGDDSGTPASDSGTPASSNEGNRNVESGQSDNSSQVVNSGSLPFTGFEAGLVALAGLGLLGAGFAMRRVARGDNTV